MMIKKLALSLLVLILTMGTTGAFAQVVVNPGWEVFVIREGATAAPTILDHDIFQNNSIEFGIFEASQKAGLATNLINGAAVSNISTLHVDRLDDVNNSGSLYGPYFNIWVTDGLGNYAVIANEPSDAEWAGSRWDVPSWDFLKTKRCKVYETTGSTGGNPGTSWVAAYLPVSGDPLTFEDVASLIIAPPSPAYIAAGNGIGGGAPDEIITNIAYGFTWVFGDTQSNYVNGDGYVVNNYSTTATFAVQNVTQGTSYATIEAALAAANPADVITIDDGTYNPPNTLSINMPLTLTGESEAGVIINIPAAGGYGFLVAAANVTMENFTLATNVANQNYPIHASGTSNAPGGFDYLTIRNVTISGAHRRAGFDIHGYNHVVLSHLTSTDATGGNGLQITGCLDVDADNITTLNNAWGSIAIYASNSSYLNRGSDDIVIDGNSCSLGEQNLFNQDEFGLFNTNITVTGYEYIVRNMNYRPGAEGYSHYQDTFADASLFALGLEVYGVGSYILTIADGNATVIPGITVQAAVGGVASGKTINILPGAYLETGQIVVDKDLTIAGSGFATTVLTKLEDSGNTGSGNDRGWILVDTGYTLNLSGVTLDGVGRQIAIGILTFGAANITDTVITNIGWTQASYYGRGICLYGGTTSTLTRVEFSNIMRIGVFAYFDNTVANIVDCTYTGKGLGDWLDYGFEAGGGAAVHATGTTVTACQGEAYDGSTSAAFQFSTYYGPGTIGTVINCVLTGNTSGLLVGYDANDTSDISVTGCDLSGNEDGVYSTAALVNAIGNWWGHATGPLDDSDDTATGGLYNPLGQGVEVSDNVAYNPWIGMAGGSISPVTTGPLNCSQSITLTFNYTADEYTPDMFLYNAVVSATSGLDFGAVVDLLPFTADNNNFFAMESGTNVWTITGSTVGNPNHPVSGAGTTGLFTITFTATDDVVGDVVIESLTLRDPDNNTIPVTLSGAAVNYDCTAPLAVTGITADPHHNKVEVNWNHDGSDVDHYEVFSGVWHDGANASVYPEYNDVAGNTIPTRPADYAAVLANSAEWFDVGDANALTADQVWPDALDRGVYYYEVFAVDAAGNASPAAANNDRATNYWLGDMYKNGVVAVADMGYLGAAFGTISTDGDYQADADVGPTDNWSRLGIPTTDNAIDFEDLMVFSMNFGVVSASNKSDVNISTTADLSWVRYDEGTYALRLNDASGLKGVHLRANLPEGASVTVTAGDLLDQQSEMTFLRNIGQDLDVSLALTGVDNGFAGQGDLFIVECSVELTMEDITIDLRGSDNSNIEVNLDSDAGTLTPRVFGLNAAYPNPFNPMTKISFSLPESQEVRLNVYGIDGKLVTTLVNETRGAGLHEVIWNGQNDAGQVQASGLYFYRIEAGPYSQVRKMTLMK